MLSIKQFNELKAIIKQIDDEREAITEARINHKCMINGSHLNEEGSIPIPISSNIYNKDGKLKPEKDFPIIPNLGPIPRR